MEDDFLPEALQDTTDLVKKPILAIKNLIFSFLIPRK